MSKSNKIEDVFLQKELSSGYESERSPIEIMSNVLKEVVRHLSSLNGSIYDQQNIPEYVKEVVNYKGMESFAIRSDGGKVIIPAEKGLPLGIGEVAQQIHGSLIGVANSIKVVSPQDFPPDSMKAILSRPEVKAALEQAKEKRFQKYKNPAKERAITKDYVDEAPISPQIMVEVLRAFWEIKELEVIIGTSVKNIKVKLPNDLVTVTQRHVDDGESSFQLGRDIKLRVPLAGMLWSFGLAGHSVLGATEYPVIYFLIGSQNSVSSHLDVLAKEIQKNLGQNQNLYDYLLINLEKLKEIIKKNAHDLKIALKSARTEGFIWEDPEQNTMEQTLGLIGQTANDIALNTKKAARDTAIMPYSSSVFFGTLEGQKKELYDQMMRAGFRPNTISENLRTLADKVSKIEKPNKGGIVNKIKTEIANDKDGYKAFASALFITRNLDEEFKTRGVPPVYSSGLNLVSRDIIPESEKQVSLLENKFQKGKTHQL